MLLLINSNRMQPPIAPIALDYLAGAVQRAGFEAEILDLATLEDPTQALEAYLRKVQPRLIGISFRNVDDCFWPSGEWFAPELTTLVSTVRQFTDAPVVLGGVGYSIFSKRLLEWTGADFGIYGDGEEALVRLLQEIEGDHRWETVPGLVYRVDGKVVCNGPAWPSSIQVPTDRAFVENEWYFRHGGQIGVESKRGCPRGCRYCVDPLAKGRQSRLRDPDEVAEEVEGLVRRGINVLHFCDSELNIPPDHAEAVCEALIRRGLGERVRWYAYLTVKPFSAFLAVQMRRAGCAGVDFTGDAAHPRLLHAYGHTHTVEDMRRCVEWCHAQGITVMFDLLLGGPGETPETVEYTLRTFRELEQDCAGVALGIRLYPETPLMRALQEQGSLEENPSIRHCYTGPIDLLRPTFYLSAALGDRPARWIREIIGEDPRFFLPQDEEETGAVESSSTYDHNYNRHQALIEAIAAGARGAYWDILRQLRRA